MNTYAKISFNFKIHNDSKNDLRLLLTSIYVFELGTTFFLTDFGDGALFIAVETQINKKN